MPGQSGLVYLDDVLTHAKTSDQPITNFDQVFWRLRRLYARGDLSRCREGVKTQVKSPVNEWPVPRTSKRCGGFWDSAHILLAFCGDSQALSLAYGEGEEV